MRVLISQTDSKVWACVYLCKLVLLSGAPWAGRQGLACLGPTQSARTIWLGHAWPHWGKEGHHRGSNGSAVQVVLQVVLPLLLPSAGWPDGIRRAVGIAFETVTPQHNETIQFRSSIKLSQWSHIIVYIIAINCHILLKNHTNYQHLYLNSRTENRKCGPRVIFSIRSVAALSASTFRQG
jgi:hypothetical protein